MNKDTNPAIIVALFMLLDHHKMGIEEAHPQYIRDKMEEFEGITFAEAWGKLDWKNHERLLGWMAKWNVTIDPTFADYFLQEKLAVKKLGLDD